MQTTHIASKKMKRLVANWTHDKQLSDAWFVSATISNINKQKKQPERDDDIVMVTKSAEEMKAYLMSL